ncbi:MAG TPA: hypothetical protein VJ950_11570, partial [Acidimicrobiia bacterium]|nr:hypothetical protein [Acidimicrobiia bacterium]
MDATRLISLAVFVVASVGLAIVGRGESWPLTVAGASLMVGSALVFFRHFWRESDQKRKQEAASHARSLTAALSKFSNETESSQLALHASIEKTSNRIDVFSRGVLEYVAQLELDVKAATETLDRRAARYRDHVLAQLSGVIGVYSVLKPTIPYPPFGGWAIGGDCAQRLVSHILASRPTWILEAGSGLSTILAAQSLELLGGEGRVISFEHEAQWLERSTTLVAEHGMSHRSEIFYTPLIDVTIQGEEFRWYDLSRVELPEEVQLIF